jgi:hypothetical protein
VTTDFVTPNARQCAGRVGRTRVLTSPFESSLIALIGPDSLQRNEPEDYRWSGVRLGAARKLRPNPRPRNQLMRRPRRSLLAGGNAPVRRLRRSYPGFDWEVSVVSCQL